MAKVGVLENRDQLKAFIDCQGCPNVGNVCIVLVYETVLKDQWCFESDVQNMVKWDLIIQAITCKRLFF